MSPLDQEQLKSRIKQRLRSEPDGRIRYTATVNAIAGRKAA